MITLSGLFFYFTIVRSRTIVKTRFRIIKKGRYVELVSIQGKRREMSIVLTESGKAFADNLLSDLYKKEAEAV